MDKQHGEEGRVKQRECAVRADAGEEPPRPRGHKFEQVLNTTKKKFCYGVVCHF